MIEVAIASLAEVLPKELVVVDNSQLLEDIPTFEELLEEQSAPANDNQNPEEGEA